MSNKLAKVLLICALVVVLPLFIAGTVIAVYYSMNAVTTFEVYTDSQIVSAPTITSGATVEYDAETGSYRVINGHSKVTSVEYSAEGFNFNYWFDGSREEYVKLIGDIANASDETIREELNAELEAKTLSTSNILSFRTGDIENITAVFSVVRYTVQYEGETYSFEYGESLTGEGKLPAFSNTDDQDFLGYIVDDNESVVYTTATFPISLEGETISVTALWKPVPSFQVRYYKNNAIIDTLTSATFNRNSDLSTIVVPDAMSQNTNGFTAVWQHNGVNFTEVTIDMLANPVYDEPNYIRVDLVETPIVYNVQISGNASGTTATYRNESSSFTVTAVNYTIFNAVRSVSNWTFGQYAWEFDDFTYTHNDASYEGDSVDALINAITTANPDSANGTINIVVNFRRVATEYIFNFYDGNNLLTEETVYDTDNPVFFLPAETEKEGYQVTNANIDGVDYDIYTYNDNLYISTTTDIFDGVLVKNVYLTYTVIPLTIEIDDTDYRGTETTIEAITIENYETKLAPLFEKDNWISYSNIQTWSENVTIGEQNFTDATSLFNHLLANYEAGDTATITSVVDCKITSVIVDGVNYEGNINLPDNPDDETYTEADFTVSILSKEGFLRRDPAEVTNESGETVTVTGFNYTLNDELTWFDLSALGDDYSIYNFLNVLAGMNSDLSGPISLGTIIFHAE